MAVQTARHKIFARLLKKIIDMKKTIVFALSAALLLMNCENKTNQDSTEVAEEQNEEKFEDSDAEEGAEFAVEAANGGLLEVQLGTLALTKATTPEVKQFAQMMVDEHGKANNELKALAQQKNITLPTTMSDDYQKKYDKLNEKSGIEFDKEYMDLMVKDHKEDVRKFEKQAEKGDDSDIKAWASRTLPTLKHHLEVAEATEEIVKEKKQ